MPHRTSFFQNARASQALLSVTLSNDKCSSAPSETHKKTTKMVFGDDASGVTRSRRRKASTSDDRKARFPLRRRS